MTCGQNLILLANAFALGIAEGKTGDDLEVLSAFFSVVGDQLAIYSACSSDLSSTSSDSDIISPESDGKTSDSGEKEDDQAPVCPFGSDETYADYAS